MRKIQRKNKTRDERRRNTLVIKKNEYGRQFLLYKLLFKIMINCRRRERAKRIGLGEVSLVNNKAGKACERLHHMVSRKRGEATP